MPGDEDNTATVTVPRDLVDAVDAIFGEAARSTYTATALREKLSHDEAYLAWVRAEQAEALRQIAGVLRDYDMPEWSTPERTSQWVHDLRHNDRRNRPDDRE